MSGISGIENITNHHFLLICRTVSWDSRRRRTIWLAPDGVTTCDSIPEALQHSGISGTKKRQLSKEEIEEAMEEAKKRGLPSGWTVRYVQI